MRRDLMWAVIDTLGLTSTVQAHGHVRADARADALVEHYEAGHVFDNLISGHGARGFLPSDENVAPYSETRIEYEIPFFDLPIAASGWVQVTDNEDGGFRCTQAQIQQALFRVRVRGDSMQPRFEDGVTIEFRLLCSPDSGLPDIERLREGEPYYVQLSDGTGTFKMLKSIEPDHLVLVAINKKYKTPLVARLADIVRVGQYEYQLLK